MRYSSNIDHIWKIISCPLILPPWGSKRKNGPPVREYCCNLSLNTLINKNVKGVWHCSKFPKLLNFTDFQHQLLIYLGILIFDTLNWETYLVCLSYKILYITFVKKPLKFCNIDSFTYRTGFKFKALLGPRYFAVIYRYILIARGGADNSVTSL